MDRDTVTLFFAMLAVALQVALVCGAVAWMIPSLRRSLVDALGPLALGFAATIAATCMLGSLYLSEVAHFMPCKFCWYQRIAMYPCAVLLVLAAVRRDHAVRRFVVPLAAIGLPLSIYHVLLERFPNLESSACDPTNPCFLIWVEKFGYVTIPVMALTGFAALLMLMGLDRSWSRSLESEQRSSHE